MRNALGLVASLVVMAAPVVGLAGGLTAEERSFFDKHVADIVQVEPTRLDDPAVVKVFATPFFSVTLTIKSPDGNSTQNLIVFRKDDKLVGTSLGHTDEELPEMVKMFNADFRLKSDDDAKTLQKALDVVYPITSDGDKQVAGFTHAGKQWTMVRGKFFENKMGYVFTTDGQGKIVSAKYVMKLK